MGIKLKNNAFSFITTSISASDVGLVVTAGDGSKFPVLGSGDYFYATLESTGNTTEIVKVTARSGDTMTIVRAQEGTSANSFAAGSRIELRVTVGNVEGGTYTPSGTSAVDRTLQAKLRDTVSVKDFGAVGDGVANDTAAFTAALAAANEVIVPSGTYVINNLTVSSGESLVVQSGAIISVNVGQKLSIIGNLEAGLYKIFDGAGSVEITPGETDEVIPHWWGASPAASASVNTSAINKSLACFKVSGTSVFNAKWRLPAGAYNINDNLQFPKLGVIEAQQCNLLFEGTLSQTNTAKGGLQIANGSGTGFFYGSIKGFRLYGDTLAQQYASGSFGVHFNGSIANCEIDIPFIYGGFKYGIAFHINGFGSSSWNKITLDLCRGPQYGFYVRSDGSVGNFFNANAIYGGDFACPFLGAANSAGFTVYGIYGTGYAYSNAYYSPAFAILNYDIKWLNQIGFTVVAPYYDTPVPNEVAADLTACSQGTWIHGYSNFDDLKFVFSSDTRAITFLNTGAYSPASPSAEFYTGISINNPVSSPRDNNVLKSSLVSVPSQARQYIANDWLNMTSYLDKGYEGNASQPTSGTYYPGGIVWNTTAIAGGSPSGYMCKTAGTAGTLSGVTGSITNGSTTLTVNNATNIKYGQYINIAGVTDAKTVLGVSGNTVTISAAANATVTGAAVTYAAPTWQALANFA